MMAWVNNVSLEINIYHVNIYMYLYDHDNEFLL